MLRETQEQTNILTIFKIIHGSPRTTLLTQWRPRKKRKTVELPHNHIHPTSFTSAYRLIYYCFSIWFVVIDKT